MKCLSYIEEARCLKVNGALALPLKAYRPGSEILGSNVVLVLVIVPTEWWGNTLKETTTNKLRDPLTFWRRNYFFLILAHSVYKM